MIANNTSNLLLVSTVFVMCFMSTLLILLKYRQREKILRAHVEKQISEIKQKNKELVKTNAIKTRLISIVSHDIITPLRFIHVTGNNLLAVPNSNEELRREILDEIVATSQDLEILTTNILNWIKYQNDKRKLVKEHFNLHELVDQAFHLSGIIAKQKGIYLTNNVAENFICYQYYEPIQVIIYNLTMNAINFMDKGHITVLSKNLNKGLFIIVKDEGFGMTRQQIDNLLSDEVVVTAANKKGKKSNGLGYLIIKDLLKVTGGKFSITSVNQKGTSIKLFFPFWGQ